MVKKFLGAAKRYALNRLDQPAIVLLYHRVTILEKDPQLLAVTPGNFYDQVDLIRKKYVLLEIEEFTDLLNRRKKLPRNAVIITFDDGYADNYYEAIPILESLESQALFYITTSKINTDLELWWDELERIILCNPSLPSQIRLNIPGRSIAFPCATDSERINTYNALHPYLKYFPPTQRDETIDSVRQSIQIDTHGRKSHRMLTTEELKKLGNSKAAVIGAHTHNHPALSVLPFEEQVKEIKQSKDILEDIFSTTITHFSYPYGSKKDYNADTIRACREIGFKMVCSNYYHQVHKWTDIFQVPRVLIRDWDLKTFSNNLSKYFKY